MDCSKIGRLIAELRKEKGLTQQNIASALNISNKAVSKWECGLGCPDASLWADLSVILGVDMAQMLEGEITVNQPDVGNINKVSFYVCPMCNNILIGTGGASIFCCGRKLERLLLSQGENIPRMTIETVDVDYYITLDHTMVREHYLLFAAYVKSDMLILNRLYPEQPPTLRIPQIPDGKLYVYCVKHGLAMYSIARRN